MIIYFSFSLLFISSIFAAQTPDHTDYTIRTGTGQATIYVVAENELHNLTRDRAEVVTVGGEMGCLVRICFRACLTGKGQYGGGRRGESGL